MAKSTNEALVFIKSVALLGFVGVIALFILYPKHQPVPEVKDDLVQNLAVGKRQSIRRASAIALATRMNEGEYNYGRQKTQISQKNKSSLISQDSDELRKFSASNAVIDSDVQDAIDQIDSGNIQSAMAMLIMILEKDPKNEQALVEMAMINLLDLKNSDEAIKYLQRVVEVNPSNRIVMSELVSLYDEEGMSDTGLNFLISQSEITGSPELSYGIGQMLASQGRNVEAVEHLEKAANGTDNYRAQKDLADAYARAGFEGKAVTAFAKTLEIQTKDVEERNKQGLPTTFAKENLSYTKLDMAKAYIQSGQLDEAQAILDEVKGALPDADAVSMVQKNLDDKRRG